MNNENDVIKEVKENKTKKRVVLIILLVLAIMFILYGIKLGKNPETKVLEYLEEKYPQTDFEISELIYSGQYEEPALMCDGSMIVPPRKVKGKYEYYYEVLSKKDNVKFILYYLDDKDEDSFTETYQIYKNIDDTIEKTANKIVEKLGAENSRVEKEFKRAEKYLMHDCNIDIYIDKNLDEEINQEYIKFLYNKAIVGLEFVGFNHKYADNYKTEVNFNVNVHYKDNKYIKFYPRVRYLYVYDENGNKVTDIEEYLGELND